MVTRKDFIHRLEKVRSSFSSSSSSFPSPFEGNRAFVFSVTA